MGSYVTTNSNAVDNRLAVTDSGFGLSSSGTGNNTALAGHIFNLNASALGGGKNGGGGTGGTINLAVTDNGAVNKALDFASSSLSDMLNSIITGQKTQLAASQYTADTIGSAIAQSATTQAAAAAGSAAVAESLQEKTQGFIVENGKKILIGLAVAGGAYWLWGRKK